uniref:hypothetical protein n=1 Tax=Acinetobacter baumannii TaxID=470 RepID=UPI00339624F5
RWYKDMFITKVMLRDDCKNDYWKERFLSGLPPRFAEKIRSKIRDRCEGKIPYSDMTYGDLTSLIHFVAMELCTDLKLKEQLKKDQKFSRRLLFQSTHIDYIKRKHSRNIYNGKFSDAFN